jgi:IS30 family transposase
VATRTVPGHGEGDLIKGARNGSAVGTLVERTTRLVILARMDGTDATSAREGFTKKLQHVPAPLRKPLTYDRGKELAEHERLAQRLAIQSSLPIRTALATRHQREHPRAVAPILAQGDRLVWVHAA